MPEYSNETLGKMLENLEVNFNKAMTELKEEHLKPIKEQTLKTNGRVTRLENREAAQNGAIALFMAIPAVAAVIKILSK